MSYLVNTERMNHVAIVRLNRPNKLNALSNELVEELKETIDKLDEEKDVRVIILTGEGKAFCAGGDIETMSQIDKQHESVSWVNSVSELSQKLLNAKTYIISAVHGYAAGAGFSLALASDFIVAHRDSKFAISFSNIGLIPDLGMIPLLKQYVSPPILKEWISSSKVLTSEDARYYQLINSVVDGDVIHESINYSQFIVDGPPLANQYVKYLVNEANDFSLTHAFNIENQIQSMLLQTEDHQEGVKAFSEKRNPNFKGK